MGNWASLGVYEISFILSAAILFVSRQTRGLNRAVFWALASFVLAVVASSRDATVGTDYYAYLRYFNDVINNDFMELSLYESEFEYGFALLVNSLSVLSLSESSVSFLVYFLLAIIIIQGLSLFVERGQLHSAVFLYLNAYWLLSYNILRQSYSVALVLVSLGYFLRQKHLLAGALFLAALSIHKSALLGLLILPLLKARLEVRTSSLVKRIALTLLLAALSLVMIRQLGLIDDVAWYVAGFFASDSNVDPVLRSVQQLVLMAPMVYLLARAAKDDAYKNYSVVVLATCFVSFVGPEMARLAIYPEVLLIPVAFHALEKYRLSPEVKFAFRLYLIFYFVGYKFAYVYSESGEVLPYVLAN